MAFVVSRNYKGVLQYVYDSDIAAPHIFSAFYQCAGCKQFLDRCVSDGGLFCPCGHTCMPCRHCSTDHDLQLMCLLSGGGTPIPKNPYMYRITTLPLRPHVSEAIQNAFGTTLLFKCPTCNSERGATWSIYELCDRYPLEWTDWDDMLREFF
jgi:hypothetical protein